MKIHLQLQNMANNLEARKDSPSMIASAIRALRDLALEIGPRNDAEEHYKSADPRFCPYCGIEGTLSGSGGVFIEAGEYIYDSYECEGDVRGYSCDNCKRMFLDASMYESYVKQEQADRFRDNFGESYGPADIAGSYTFTDAFGDGFTPNSDYTYIGFIDGSAVFWGSDGDWHTASDPGEFASELVAIKASLAK
jgi:hypothetical protein